MVRLFTGTPGSGKSLHAMEVIYKKLKYTKVNVITNVALDLDFKLLSPYKDRVFILDNNSITPSFFESFAVSKHIERKESQTLIVIDEAQMLFSPNVVKLKCQEDKNYRKEWLDFFSQHRHFGFDVILITQYDKLIDAQVRCMAEYEIRHRKINNFKVGMLLSVFRLQLFIAVEYWVGVYEKIGSSFFIYRSKYAKMYNAYSRFSKSEIQSQAPSAASVGAAGSFVNSAPAAGSEAVSTDSLANFDTALLRQARVICNHGKKTFWRKAMGFFRKIILGEKYDFIDYKSLRNTVAELDYHISCGMACFVYFNVSNGKTFTVESSGSAVGAYSFNDSRLLLIGKYNRHNPVPDEYGLADDINKKLEEFKNVPRKKTKL